MLLQFWSSLVQSARHSPVLVRILSGFLQFSVSNAYAYSDNDPANANDPRGLCAERSGRSVFGCALSGAAENQQELDRAVSGVRDRIPGLVRHTINRVVSAVESPVASSTLRQLGLETSGSVKLFTRWLFYRSAVPEMAPLIVQGIRVGATRGLALSGTALTIGVGTNIVAGFGTGLAAQGGYVAGTYLGSFAVGLWDCLIGGSR